jgi:hypothetical protein
MVDQVVVDNLILVVLVLLVAQAHLVKGMLVAPQHRIRVTQT